jgi:hypothetical protein
MPSTVGLACISLSGQYQGLPRYPITMSGGVGIVHLEEVVTDCRDQSLARRIASRQRRLQHAISPATILRKLVYTY